MQTFTTRQTKQLQTGFSLIELMVSLTLFTVVTIVGLGTLLVLIDANGRSQSMQLVMTNLSFALDSMTREVRTGYNWYCWTPSTITDPIENGSNSLRDCASGSALSIVEAGESLTGSVSGNNRITYYLDANYYTAETGIPNHGAIMRRIVSKNQSIPLTGPDIVVDQLRFSVTGTGRLSQSDERTQPAATIYVRGRAGVFADAENESQVREFNLQTTVSQRLLDI